MTDASDTWPADPPPNATEQEWEDFYDKCFETAAAHTLDSVYGVMREALDKEQKTVQYTQAVHDGHLVALAVGLAGVKALIGKGGALRRQLEARVAALESKSEKAISDWGVWKSDVEYPAGAAVTHQGGLWISKMTTTACRPGDGALWRLAVKKGSAG